MRVIYFFVVSGIFLFSNCGENSKPNDSKKIPSKENLEIEKTNPAKAIQTKTQDTIPKKIPIPSTSDSIDYWTLNNCSVTKPSATVPENKRPSFYSFTLNEKQGYGREVLKIENGYKLDINTSGCDEYLLKFSYFFKSKELNIKDSKAVSNKVLELLQLTTQISNPPYDFKSQIPKIEKAIQENGNLEKGEKIILNNEKEIFEFEHLQERNGKIFLSYYFKKK